MFARLSTVSFAKHNPEIWDHSFTTVNLHPFEQVSFQEWYKRTEKELQAAYSYDLVAKCDNNPDLYRLLPNIWQAMTLEEKSTVVTIVKKYETTNPWGIHFCCE